MKSPETYYYTMNSNQKQTVRVLKAQIKAIEDEAWELETPSKIRIAPLDLKKNVTIITQPIADMQMAQRALVEKLIAKFVELDTHLANCRVSIYNPKRVDAREQIDLLRGILDDIHVLPAYTT